MKLFNCGLSSLDAESLARDVAILTKDNTAENSWLIIAKTLLHPSLPASVHSCVHHWVFQYWDPLRGPAPAWFPTSEEMERTNVGKLLRELQLDSLPDLYRWSIYDRNAYWHMMIERLGIRFRKAYERLLASELSTEHHRWLSGARLNIVDSCFGAPTEAIAIRHGDSAGTISNWTYGQLEILTNQVACSLQEFGMRLGDVVAICTPMTPEAVAIYLGIIRAGCVVVSIADSFSSSEIATRLHIAHAKAVFAQDYVRRGGRNLPLYAKMHDAQAPRTIVLPCENKVEVPLQSDDIVWEDFLSKSAKDLTMVCQPDDHTNYLFSSGTTGEPKVIPWTHVTPIKCAADGFIHQDIQSRDIVAWPTNIGWMMGPWLIYASLINKATIALFNDAPNSRAFGQFVQDAGVTVLGVIPSLVSTWKTTGCMDNLDWSAIKCFSSTGESSNADDMLYLMALARYKPVIEYCGGTELAGGYLSGTLVQPQAPATFSTPTLGTELTILEEDGKPADIGEVFLVPPAIGMSTELLNRDHDEVYYRGTPQVTTGQILRRHGDFIERLPCGYYRVHGRADDTMNLGGIKVSSGEIERVLKGLTAISETAAIAVPISGGGPSQLIIIVVLEPGATVTSGELKPMIQEAIRRELNPLFHVHDVRIVERMPRTASNKVMRRELRIQFNEMLLQLKQSNAIPR